MTKDVDTNHTGIAAYRKPRTLAKAKPFYPSVFFNIREQLYGFAYTNYDQPLVTKGIKEYVDASDLFTQQQKSELIIRAMKAHPDRLGGLTTLARLNHIPYEPLLAAAYDLWQFYPVYQHKSAKWWVILTDDFKLALVRKTKQQVDIDEFVYEPSGFTIEKYGMGGRIAYPIPAHVHAFVSKSLSIK